MEVQLLQMSIEKSDYIEVNEVVQQCLCLSFND